MHSTSFPGPDRPGPSQLTDADEVRECRRQLREQYPRRGRYLGTFGDGTYIFEIAPGADPDWLSDGEVEAVTAGMARDLERWGESPFDLE